MRPIRSLRVATIAVCGIGRPSGRRNSAVTANQSARPPTSEASAVARPEPGQPPEARVLYELGRHAPTHATALGQELGLDAGYLSRILRGFERRGLLERTPSKTDGRQSVLALTAQGRNAFARLDGASRREIGTLLAQLAVPPPARLEAAMLELRP